MFKLNYYNSSISFLLPFYKMPLLQKFTNLNLECIYGRIQQMQCSLLRIYVRKNLLSTNGMHLIHRLRLYHSIGIHILNIS